jgi:hypothetical protein
LFVAPPITTSPENVALPFVRLIANAALEDVAVPVVVVVAR